MMSAIKAEMQLFANTGNTGRCPEKVYSYLISIPATSVEAERASYNNNNNNHTYKAPHAKLQRR